MKLLPPLERNPVGHQLDPRDAFTVLLPSECTETISVHGAVLTREVRQWLCENAPEYACRVIETLWLSQELVETLFGRLDGMMRVGRPATSRRYHNAAFITFQNENDALLFKLRWC